jgi:hypothetical protein
MLGELLGEGSGKVTAVRVLPTEGQQVRLEVSIQGKSKLLGVETTDTATYSQTVRPGNVLYGEGHWVVMSREGEIADWTGFGVGKPTGPAPAAHYGVCGSFHTASGRLARLSSLATVLEYDTAEDGTYHFKIWEWK